MRVSKSLMALAGSCSLLLCLAGAGPEQKGQWLQQQKLTQMDGEEYALGTAAAQGDALVLIFWTPWCGSCAKEAPELVKAAERYQDRATFVGVVAGDDRSIQSDKVERFIKKHHLTYPTLRDRELTVTKGLKVRGTPTIIVIDPEMNILYRGHKAPESWSAILPPA